MKAVILAGGIGSRISEESLIRPKPMVEIGGKPILWHILKIYSHYGINDFIICCGYKGEMIKEFFVNYNTRNSDFTIDIKNQNIKVHKRTSEEWNVTLVDTGKDSMTGGRISRIKKYLSSNEDFCLTYGDGVSNVNIKKLINFHKKHKKPATMTIVLPPGRFGMVKFDKKNLVKSFVEKPSGDGSWINGGFFVLNSKVLNLVNKDTDVWEKKPLENLSKGNKLMAFKHSGFWKAMDTLKDKTVLEEMWISNPLWKVWKD